MGKIDYLQNLFNRILDYEHIPISWSQSKITCIYKKGEKNDPNNYRGIALLNTLTKIFTQLLNNRIMNWAEKESIIPEQQAGFRKGRGCIDQIFTLNSLIQIQLKYKEQKLYTCFVDFKRCFDLLSHRIIWQKLYKTELSPKLIRIIQKLYENAKCRIKVNNKNEYTDEIKITKGLLQGDSASPLLFSLVTSDIVKFLEEKGCSGIQLANNVNPCILMYADDLVLLGHSKIDLQKKINVLGEYCLMNELEVNTEKTKIIVFRKGGKLARTDKFYYGQEQLDIVSTYTYLGVVFSSSGRFGAHLKQATSKASKALANVRQIMVNSKMNSWDSRIHLYETIVKVTLLYAAEVWALNYCEEIEKTQTKFIKMILCLYNTTPNHYLRLETGIVKLTSAVLKASLRWWMRVKTMSDSRLPKLCLLKLEQIETNRYDETYNWVSQIKKMYGETNEPESLNLEYVKKNFDTIIQQCENQLTEKDTERLRNSSYNEYYKIIKQNKKTETYLKFKVPIDKIRIVAQLRMAGERVNFLTRGERHAWGTAEICGICNLRKEESLEHILLECPHYEQLRKKYLEKLTHRVSSITMEQILNVCTEPHLNDLYAFVKAILKRRKFLRNE